MTTTDQMDAIVRDYLEGRAGALTPGGLPYPLDTEPVAQGAAAIQALATALDPYLLGSYRIHNAVDSVSVGTGAWSGIGIKTLEASSGTDLSGSGNGMLVNRAGVYRIDLMIQNGNGTNVTLSIGPGRSTDAGPTGTQRSSSYANNAALSNNGSWLVKCAAGEIWMAFVTHNNSANLAFTTRRMAMQRVGT